MKDFRDLRVWEKAHELALACYAATTPFPKHEVFGLTSQIRRAGASISANIAEGCGRRGNGEFHRFLQIAMVLQVNLNITCCYHAISNFLETMITSAWNRRLQKSSECWLP